MRIANPAKFAHKVVININAANRLDMSTGKPMLLVWQTDSGGETVQRLLPDGKVVKALNIISARKMVNSAQSGGEPDMFISGDHADAKKAVMDILTQVGAQSSAG